VVSSNALLAIQTPSLVGEWLNGTAAATNLVDVSGYSLAANHGAYIVGNGNLVFTNDVPPGKTGYSAFFYNGDTGLAISNSSTWDANYDSTFDNQINNAFTVSCWGRGFPAGWYPFVSKWGEGRPHNSPDGGWQLRADGNGINPCFTVRDEQIGTFGYGCNTNDATDDMATTLVAGNDGCWHFYSGTFNAVTGIRCLYVDGVLAAQETNNVQYDLASWAHLCIGGKDLPPGNSFGFFSTFEIYDVRIYNYALTNGVLPPSPPPPHLSVQPQSVLVFTNTTAQFRATASGTAPLVYQWTLNGTNVNLLPDSANFTGANSNVLTILNVATNDAGSYQLIVTNLYGSAISSNAFLTIEQPALVGEWFAGNTNLADVSGYQPAGTHDGYVIAGSYSFSSDVPPLRPGKSLNIAANSGIAISNSSTLDAAYTNTFDDTIHDAMSVTFWAKGFPGSWSWNPCVSKYGEGPGWQFREGGGPGQIPCWTVRDNGTGVFVQGAGPGWAMGGDLDDLHAATGVGGGASYYNVDNNWHFYAGTFDANTTLRNLYIDGVLWGQETNNMQYNMAPAEHLVIGAKDSPPGNNYGSYGGPFNIYDVRIYNYALTQQQVQPPHPPPGPTPPQITQQPPGSINTTCVGVTVQIGAIAGGGGPLTNQWQFNGTNLVDGNYGGVVISGSQSIAPASGFETTLLTIANVTTNYSGVYTLIVSDANGSVVSSNANLTVGTDSVAPVPAGALVGEWLNGTNSLADTSGYSPAGTHDAKVQSGAVWWTNDVPPIAPPGSQSLYFNNAGLTVSNSSTLDANYTNTFDLAISNSMTIECWAKGWPGSWNPFVSKYGENGIGWQLRCDGWNTACWTVRAPTGGGDMGAPATSNDSFWHHYAGTYDVTSGLMKLYIDGVLAVTWTGVGPYNLSPPSHLMIGARDGGGNAFGNYYSGEIYGVQIYDTALSADQVNASLVSPVTVPPTFSGPIAITSGPSGSQLVLKWPYGTLLQATNVAGPWTPVAGAVSPYTNLINMTAPNMFYKLSNP
ncbi:MAG: LamG-like jellyroll fold domain-containing protein, partial [Verrucomicrobiota bacterium]